jgi:hypothetical protein
MCDAKTVAGHSILYLSGQLIGQEAKKTVDKYGIFFPVKRQQVF